ncbi:NAD(P)H-hydrate dehydratase [Limnobacter humi]|uniref:Multifunctional fusion protein n=1 Tax=Limnobacter humi TaxID=1778671 RepID=A0ABT1WFB1_9BURK|nr:NAD(P)H-hydrate dehydratase [Limnobacter humi]MCQ8896203.1 NAD(P)H-hydrate dehydratase [Limnobacter humi]
MHPAKPADSLQQQASPVTNPSQALPQRNLNTLPSLLEAAAWQPAHQQDWLVLSVEQVRQVEHAAFREVASYILMQAAGQRSAQKIMDLVQHLDHRCPQVVVLAGPGNNGGDACVVANALAEQGLPVELWQFKGGREGSADRQKAEAGCKHPNLRHSQWGKTTLQLKPGALVVDGLLGIAGRDRPKGPIAEVIAAINAQREGLGRTGHVHVVALDCPSGLDCDTGLAPGEVLAADLTLTYIAAKTGLFMSDGKDVCGEIWLDTLHCDALIHQRIAQGTLGAVVRVRGRLSQMQRLPRRQHAQHKGSFGSVAVLGGQHGMVGAAVLTARSALLMGAGRVALSLLAEHGHSSPDVQWPGTRPFLDLNFPEIMNKPLQDNCNFAEILAVGPGLGTSPEAQDWLDALFDEALEHGPLGVKKHHWVLDADALNLLAEHNRLKTKWLKLRKQSPECHAVITPHPLEAARLLNSTVDAIQRNRPDAARELARQFDCVAVLKGAGTVIAANHSPATRIEINGTGGPALGTAGSGDVLTGAVAALLGQGLTSFDAAACAVWLHGLSVNALPGENQAHRVSHASAIAQRMAQHYNQLLQQGTR